MTASERAKYQLLSQRPSFKRLVAQTLQVIEQAVSLSQSPYCSWSGGKDSTAMLHLVRQIKPDCSAAFFDSGAEFPDVLEFIESTTEKWGLNLLWMEPSMSVLDIYRSVGLHGSGERLGLAVGETKRILFEEPSAKLQSMGYDCAFIGLRADESVARRWDMRAHGAIHRMVETGILHCKPMHHWTSRDVWTYTVSNDLPWCAMYDKPWPGGREAIRTGIYAGGTIETLAQGRWAFMRRHYPQLWNRFRDEFPNARWFA